MREVCVCLSVSCVDERRQYITKKKNCQIIVQVDLDLTREGAGSYEDILNAL
jgi:hypothetical protein